MGQNPGKMAELGAFLRSRREQLDRAAFDLPPLGRSRTPGLRREEIAYRAGVSITWYTWLEQGRDINPSRQVLDALAVTLRLSAAEQDYLYTLAGYTPASAAGPLLPSALPAHLQRLLDAQLPSPAFAVSPDWTITGWNGAYEALYPGVATVAPEDRNLLQLIFTDPYVRDLLPDWEVMSRRFLAEYRGSAGPLLGQAVHVALVKRIIATSGDFERAWQAHRVERFESRERRFLHPVAGELVFEHHRLIPSDLPDVHLVVYLADHRGDTAAKMRQLLAAGEVTT
ncbi:helix-turn-helix domain-containing protein [Rhodococcus sp. D2-41]|uniref:helix-turn-helix transcriptional regulator n=1 Tax=Speluncibacter jeojiensis TaxID=2710754 RepID=UPI00385446EF|nr:helix-turn-helix domain-containing protein [Rhodococcus sp. D2-41]